ncbi:hypothetical protein M8C21_007369 [Ambrosia artemisiifolia]|uniref:Uncharacterized protein n=1 Tax=Ambrosia artemisiifolia TaxID=4212 RepID=A0AAD5GEB2_AMBAR|nr:hypothetical protein M8C21_007369 [Ambrosia artemisiifolia]
MEVGGSIGLVGGGVGLGGSSSQLQQVEGPMKGVDGDCCNFGEEVTVSLDGLSWIPVYYIVQGKVLPQGQFAVLQNPMS